MEVEKKVPKSAPMDTVITLTAEETHMLESLIEFRDRRDFQPATNKFFEDLEKAL